MKGIRWPRDSMFAEYTFDAMAKTLYETALNRPLAILVHARPDGDCVGSGFALKALLAAVGCESRVVCQDRLPERLKFIAKGDQDDISAESAEGRFAPGSGVPAIALDVAAPEQLGTLNGKYDIVLSVDHHRSSVAVSDRYLDAGASATGEIIWRIARAWLRFGYISEIPRKTAEAAYAAISSDTGCFRYSNVTAATHRIAAKLIEIIPDHAEIDRLLFEVKTEGRLKAEKAALEALRLYDGGRISVCPMSAETFRSLGIEPEELDALIDVARSSIDVELAFSIREEGPGRYRVSARSNVNADVSELCARFGGGGHARAAGCELQAKDIEDAVGKILAAARELKVERSEQK